jgi:hypothetical protein
MWSPPTLVARESNVALKPGLTFWNDQNTSLNCTLRLAVIAICALAASGCANLRGLSASSPSKQALATALALPNAIVGTTYSTVLPANEGRPPYVFTVRQGALPAGLALNTQTGGIAGIPSQAGSSDFTISVTDSLVRHSESRGYTVRVDPCDSCSKITISPINPTVAAGGKIQFTATVTGTSHTAVTWSASAGAVSTTGLFVAPAKTTLKTISVSAINTALPSAKATTTVVLSTTTGGNLRIATSSLPGATRRVAYTALLQATGGSAPYQWSIASGSLPSGLQLSSITGDIAGSPVQTGTFPLTLSASDAAGHTAQQSLTLLVSASQQCGPPTYKCSRTDFGLVRLRSSAPNVGNLTGVNTIVSDPDFGSRIVRATDWNTDPATPQNARSYVTAGSGGSNENMWNLDSTMLVISNTNNMAYPLTFDPVTMQVKRMYVSSYPGNGGMWFTYGGTWSRVDPNVLYAYNGSAIDKYDFSDRINPPSPQTVFDFTSSSHCLPAGFKVTWSARAGVSAGDVVFGMAFSNTGNQGTGVYVVVYKAGSGCSVLNTQTGQVSGDWGSTGTISLPDRWTVHSGKVTLDGNWFMISPTQCLSSTCAVGPYFWHIGTTTVTACQTGQDCSGHNTEGYSHWVNNSAAGKQWIRLPSDLSKVQELTGVIPVGLAAPLDTHPSWNNADPADSVPFLLSTCSPTTPFPAPWYNEVLGVATDGSGRVWRFAHTFVTSQSQRFATKYGIGSVSQDGRFFAFSSDWMGTLGSEPGTVTCTIGKDCRGDVFVVELK